MFEASSTGSGKSKEQMAQVTGVVGALIVLIASALGEEPPLEIAGSIAVLLMFAAGFFKRRAGSRVKPDAAMAPHQAKPEPHLSMPESRER